MNTAQTKLVSLAGDILQSEWSDQGEQLISEFGLIGNELLNLLRLKNGFYAFESALHIFPNGYSSGHMSLFDWNQPLLWREAYGELLPSNILFFAEDAYGNQFGIMGDEVILFFSEFAEIEVLAKTLNEWIELLLTDWRGFTGYELAHKWQIQHKPLAHGERLVPKKPFVLGGKYEVHNLYAGNAIDTMRFRGSLARQLGNLPDGTPINMRIK